VGAFRGGQRIGKKFEPGPTIRKQLQQLLCRLIVNSAGAAGEGEETTTAKSPCSGGQPNLFVRVPGLKFEESFQSQKRLL
jgi:hypothetical protein